MEQKNITDTIIVSATPQFLERGVLWFAENETAIKNAIKKQLGTWNNSALILEHGASFPPGILARKLFNLGYEKTSVIFGKGEYTSRGNIIEVAPINSNEQLLIEFYGNIIERIIASPLRQNTLKKIIRAGGHAFQPEDYVVHIDHGIGIYKGMTHISESQEEFFEIEYASPRAGAKPDTLYVPISQKKKLDAYIGFETPTIHRLGGVVWFNTRTKAREEIESFAKELLIIYKKRAQARRQALHCEPDIEMSFAESFPYEETADQKKAINEILHDLAEVRPMDRVLAGDV
ncbi:MAG: CarD family transcriptional regulator, partial [Patescibacteria group bacterium]